MQRVESEYKQKVINWKDRDKIRPVLVRTGVPACAQREDLPKNVSNCLSGVSTKVRFAPAQRAIY